MSKGLQSTSPRTLRVLKKLSKRAAPYLHRIKDTRKQFRAEKDENYHGLLIPDMKRLERCPSAHDDVIDKEHHVATLTPKCRANTSYPYLKLRMPCHPLKGTVMVGDVSGYFQPEWDEESAWTALENWVYGHYLEYDHETEELTSSRRFSTPNEIFEAADHLLSAKN